MQFVLLKMTSVYPQQVPQQDLVPFPDLLTQNSCFPVKLLSSQGGPHVSPNGVFTFSQQRESVHLPLCPGQTGVKVLFLCAVDNITTDLQLNPQ